MFRGYFRLKERCPTCGYQFRREEGFLLGVYLVNFALTLFLVWLVIMGWVIWRAGAGSDGTVWPTLLLCLALAVVVPVVAYPFAATTWAALDLVMRPLEPDEEADAATWAVLDEEGDGEGV